MLIIRPEENIEMTISESEVWDRVRRYEIDDPSSTTPFSQRLANENGWPLAYAKRVIQEYLRFCYLAVVAEHKVSPSDEIDQAWHLHQLYSEEYWKHFCPTILGISLHHGPTKGGEQEDVKYHEWYEKTKASYAMVFGENPPADIWPDSSVRFGRSYMRVCLQEHIIIKRDDFPVISRIVVALLNWTLRFRNFLRRGEI